MKIDEIYKGHAKALSKAGLDPKICPTLKEIWKKADASKLNYDARREKRSGGRERTMYFCIFYLIYGRRRFTTSFKNFLIPTVLNGFVRGYPIIDSQT